MIEPVTSLATDTTLEIDVTSAFDGAGAAVNHSTASISAEIKNISQADDIWYQIDSGAFVQLTERQSAEIVIDFSAQTLKLKRGEFSSSSVPVQVIARGVPAGLYARGQAVGMSLPALAALGVYPNARTVEVHLVGAELQESLIDVIDAPGVGYWNDVHAVSTQCEPGLSPSINSSDGEMVYDGPSDSIFSGYVFKMADSTAVVSHCTALECGFDRSVVENKKIQVQMLDSLAGEGITNECWLYITYTVRAFNEVA